MPFPCEYSALWTLSVFANSSLGAHLQGVVLSITDINGTLVRTNQITDAQGLWSADLPEFSLGLARFIGFGDRRGDQVNASPYTVTASYQGSNQTQVVVLNASKQITFTFSTCSSCSSFDVNCNNKIDDTEVLVATQQWLTGVLSMDQLMITLKQWRQGCH